MSDSSEHEQEIYLAATNITSFEERDEFLEEKCAGDDQLRTRLDALLLVHEQENTMEMNRGAILGSQSSSRQFGNWEPPLPEELEPMMPGYRIAAVLGQGGMGAVYRGVQENLDREVAIKLLPPEMSADAEFAARFQREAKAMAKLNHPNIVQIYDFGKTTDGLYFFAMEFVEGTDMSAYVKSGHLSAADAIVAVGRICDALQYAHEKGFIHRDIKPANIFLSNDGLIKVGDFGLAKLIETEGGQTTATELANLTMTGVAMGTPNYIAPEQLEAREDMDHRADLFSLGVMFYEMLTGDIPRGAVKPPSARVRDLDVRIDDVVFKAMDNHPEDRYQSAADLSADLERIRTSSLESKTAEVSSARAGKKRAVSWYVIGGLIVFLIVGGIALFPPGTKVTDPKETTSATSEPPAVKSDSEKEKVASKLKSQKQVSTGEKKSAEGEKNPAQGENVDRQLAALDAEFKAYEASAMAQYNQLAVTMRNHQNQSQQIDQEIAQLQASMKDGGDAKERQQLQSRILALGRMRTQLAEESGRIQSQIQVMEGQFNQSQATYLQNRDALAVKKDKNSSRKDPEKGSPKASKSEGKSANQQGKRE